MTKRLKLIALGLSIILFTGCGGADTTDATSNAEDTRPLPSTSEEATDTIRGTWKTGCIGTENEQWTKKIIVFNPNNTGSYTKNQYTSLQCDDSELDSTEVGTWNYLVGNKTVGTDGLEAYELDITDEGTDYFMVRFYEVYEISFADKNDDENIGNTPATRSSDFTDSEHFYRTE